jgi:hypothetical protein
MSDCDVQAMDDYMSNEWEPDHIHIRLKEQLEAKDDLLSECRADMKRLASKLCLACYVRRCRMRGRVNHSYCNTVENAFTTITKTLSARAALERKA